MILILERHFFSFWHFVLKYVFQFATLLSTKATTITSIAVDGCWRLGPFGICTPLVSGEDFLFIFETVARWDSSYPFRCCCLLNLLCRWDNIYLAPGTVSHTLAQDNAPPRANIQSWWCCRQRGNVPTLLRRDVCASRNISTASFLCHQFCCAPIHLSLKNLCSKKLSQGCYVRTFSGNSSSRTAEAFACEECC